MGILDKFKVTEQEFLDYCKEKGGLRDNISLSDFADEDIREIAKEIETRKRPDVCLLDGYFNKHHKYLHLI